MCHTREINKRQIMVSSWLWWRWIYFQWRICIDTEYKRHKKRLSCYKTLCCSFACSWSLAQILQQNSEWVRKRACVLRNMCDSAAGFVIIQLAVFLAATFARGQKVLLVVVVDLSSACCWCGAQRFSLILAAVMSFWVCSNDTARAKLLLFVLCASSWR